jgi:membrane protein
VHLTLEAVAGVGEHHQDLTGETGDVVEVDLWFFADDPVVGLRRVFVVFTCAVPASPSAAASSLQVQQVLDWGMRTQLFGGALLRVLALLPIVFNALALGVLYAVMPNRRPSLPALVLSACIAGAAWHGVQLVYVTLQIGVAHYNAIYGALAQLPVTLVWIYVSWAVVLAGAELAAVCEFGPQCAGATAALYGGAVALHVLVRAAEHFRGGAGALALQALARELRVDRALVAETAELLRRRGLLVAIEGAEESYVLARDPETIDLALLPELMSRNDLPPGCDPRVAAQLDQLQRDQQAQLRRHNLADLCGHRRETTG